MPTTDTIQRWSWRLAAAWTIGNLAWIAFVQLANATARAARRQRRQGRP
jgi:hypothetical protein